MRDLAELCIKPYGNYRPFPTPEDQNIRDFERAFGVELPQDYVRFLRFKNGGTPKMKHVGVGRGYTLNDFFGLGQPQDVDSYDWAAGNLWAETPIKRQVLSERDVPIARDPGGGVFFLRCHAGSAVVHFLEGSTRKVLVIASSFSDFLDVLQPH